MAIDIVYFDLETQRSSNDVGGWANMDKMGMSIGVTYSSRLGGYTIYDEAMVDELIAQLARADLVVGFNHVGFDYQVLQGYSMWDVPSLMNSFDIMLDLEAKIGHRPKLEDVAMASLGTGKSANGVEAIKWWREGKIKEIAYYCCHDVKLTRRVHEYGMKHGMVKYFDRVQREQVVAVDWAKHLPLA